MSLNKELQVVYKDGQICHFWGRYIEIKNNRLYLDVFSWWDLNYMDEIKCFVFDGKYVDIHQEIL